MKNLIYQYWDGNIRPGVTASTKNIAKYAKKIGADHVFEHNPKTFHSVLGESYGKYYGAFKHIFTDSFSEYDNILFLDCDIFAVEGLSENIFEGFESDIGICTEPFQPMQRTITLGQITSERDEQWSKLLKRKWNIDLPRTRSAFLQVYNSGVVLYSRKGIEKARQSFLPPDEYIKGIQQAGLINFYALDQNYLHAMIFYASLDYIEMDNNWNSYIHKTFDKINPVKRINDCRTKDSKFVHIQMGGADSFDEQTLYRMTNHPMSLWGLPE